MRSARLRILRAMLRGQRVTPMEANRIGRTTEGTRIIRRLRETYPVLDVKIEGKRHHEYFLAPEYIEEYRKKNVVVRFWENVKELF